MALSRVWMPSPNYSSRGGSAIRLIVLHTAEGALTIESLGNFFAQSSSGVSSQVGIDDKPGKIGEYVSRSNKAWTQGNANPVADSAELCGFASWSRSTWLNSHRTMLENTAAWLAEESAATGVPLVKLTPSQAQGSGRGVCQHIDLGSWGGGHVDCGSGFPIDDVIAWAKGGTTAPPVKPPEEEPEMLYGSLAPEEQNDIAFPAGSYNAVCFYVNKGGGGLVRMVLTWNGNPNQSVSTQTLAENAPVTVGFPHSGAVAVSLANTGSTDVGYTLVKR